MNEQSLVTMSRTVSLISQRARRIKNALVTSHQLYGGNELNEEKTIEASISEFIRVYNAGDLEGVLAYYSDDLIKIRQGGPAETKAETAKRVAGVFDKFHSRVDVTNDEIRVAGEMAYTRGTFRVTLSPKAGGERQIIERRYLEIWLKEDGRWRVARTMDNTQ
jgi:ketosteroid isomerase-like protein